MQGPARGARPREVSIVVPTFREAANIPTLAKRIRSALSGSGIEWELLLIDDDSGDGSEAVVAELARRLPVRMEVRRDGPRDLSLAVLQGLRHSRCERVVVMDADLSHPPERIPDLLAALDGDCDMALGSRYVSGGSFGRAWGLWRFLNSRLATVLTLPLVNCSDPMSGFFAIRRQLLPDPGPEPGALRPVGYKIALELMVRLQPRLKEVPYEFQDRDRGDSKMGWRQRFDYLRHLHRLYLHRFGDLLRMLYFGCVGASGFIVDVLCYLCLQWLGLGHRLARFISFWPAVTWNWWLNRHLSFSGRRHRPCARQWARFVASSLFGFGVSYGTYIVLTAFVPVFSDHRLLALVCGVVLGGVVNFLAANLYVYRLHSDDKRAPAGRLENVAGASGSRED